MIGTSSFAQIQSGIPWTMAFPHLSHLWSSSLVIQIDELGFDSVTLEKAELGFPISRIIDVLAGISRQTGSPPAEGGPSSTDRTI
jgi:hypothetical protein